MQQEPEVLKKLEKFFRQSIETEAEVIENALGGVETGRGKIAGGGEEFTVDPSIELFGEAAHDNTAGERVDEEADEITIEEIVINSIRGV